MKNKTKKETVKKETVDSALDALSRLTGGGGGEPLSVADGHPRSILSNMDSEVLAKHTSHHGMFLIFRNRKKGINAYYISMKSMNYNRPLFAEAINPLKTVKLISEIDGEDYTDLEQEIYEKYFSGYCGVIMGKRRYRYGRSYEYEVDVYKRKGKFVFYLRLPRVKRLHYPRKIFLKNLEISPDTANVSLPDETFKEVVAAKVLESL